MRFEPVYTDLLKGPFPKRAYMMACMTGSKCTRISRRVFNGALAALGSINGASITRGTR